jgi:hypothetical protein
VGFLQTLMAERLIELAWKLRRAAKAQCKHAGNRLGDDVETTRTMRKAGAWDGPDVSPTGTDMLLDAAEGDKEARPFLTLDLYADRCQRAFQLGLSALRREQKRREERVGPDVEEEEAEAGGGVAVELGEDPTEDAHFVSKATAGEQDPGEPEDLTQYIREASADAIKAAALPYLNANSQNKATAGSNGAQRRGNGEAEKRAPEPTPAPRYDGPVEQKRTQGVGGAADGGSVRTDGAAKAQGVDGRQRDVGAVRRPGDDSAGPSSIAGVSGRDADEDWRVDPSSGPVGGGGGSNAYGSIPRPPRDTGPAHRT